MAIWLLPRSQEEPEFMRGLIRFARTGAITDDLKSQLRTTPAQPSHPSRPHAARLLQYAVARGNDLGPIGDDFGAVCDQIDHADAILDELRERVSKAARTPTSRRGPAREIHPEPIAMARHDPVTRPSPSSSTPPPPKPPSTPSPSTPSTAKPAPARSGSTGQTSPKAPTAEATARPSPPAKHAIATRLRAIERAYRAALDPEPPQHPNSARYSPLPAGHPIMNWNWSNTLGTRR